MSKERSRSFSSRSRSRSRSRSCSPRRRYSYSRSRSPSYTPPRRRGSYSPSPRRRRSFTPSPRRSRRSISPYSSRRQRSYSRSYSRSRSRSYSRSRSPNYRRRRSYSPRRSYHHRSRDRSPMSNRRRHVGNRYNPSATNVIGIFGLSLYTTERDLRDILDKFGEIREIKVVFDHQTGKSRGFAFVYFEDIHDAIEAKEQCNGIDIDGRKIRVDYSITKRAHTPTPGVYMGKPTRSGDRYDDDRGDRRERDGDRRERDGDRRDRDRDRHGSRHY